MTMRFRPLAPLSAVAAAAALSLLAAGCGGGGSPSIPSVASTTPSSASASPPAGLAGYTRCMRAHGVSNFPYPDSTGGIPKPGVIAAQQGDPNRFTAADTACHALLPDGSLAPPETAQQRQTKLADALSFARCMRSHGIARFPDPTAQGDLSVAMVQAQGIDVRSPQVLRVVQTCLPASHGGLTAAKVREAIANAGH